MHAVEVKLLPFNVGRFRLEDPGGDEARSREMGRRLQVARQGPNWRISATCAAYPESDVSIFRLELYELGELVGTFMPYACITLSQEDDVRHLSAMLVPVLGSEIGSAIWLEDIAYLMLAFLENDLECDDGTYISVDEWRFPLAARGDRSDQEWFGASSVNQDKLPAFIAEMDRQGMTVELDDRGVPDRAVLTGGNGG